MQHIGNPFHNDITVLMAMQSYYTEQRLAMERIGRCAMTDGEFERYCKIQTQLKRLHNQDIRLSSI